jgi:D-alanyl-D-alanine carboxypeptidase (penicillin-binding protein 5/6)
MTRRPRGRGAAWLVAIALACVAHAACEPGVARAATEPDPFPGAARAYAVTRNGAPLWSAHGELPLPPASLTKLMTALLVAEAGGLEQPVTISARAAAAPGARLPLRAGVRVSRGDLLTAMLLRSANDACLALAESIGGTEAAFVVAMNQRAARLGLRQTRFRNACGLDGPGHVMSARDVATLAEAALAAPAVASRVRLADAAVHVGDKEPVTVTTTNALIGRVHGAVGAKTGFTNRAGHCLVGVVDRDGVRVVVVLLGARDRWWDAVAMIERAFDAAPAAAPARAPGG